MDDSLLRAVMALAQASRAPQPMPAHVHDSTGQEQGPFPQPMPAHSQVDRSQWDRREDGSAKGDGFLGLLARPDGGVSSEISAGFDGMGPGGAEADIPTVVPTLSPAEISFLLNMNVSRDKVPQSIVEKAIAYAKQRRAQGKPYFAGPGEANYALDPQFKRVQ